MRGGEEDEDAQRLETADDGWVEDEEALGSSPGGGERMFALPSYQNSS